MKSISRNLFFIGVMFFISSSLLMSENVQSKVGSAFENNLQDKSILIPNFLDHKKIELEQFHLYKILTGIKAALLVQKIGELQTNDASFIDSQSSPLQQIEQSIQALKSIVLELNMGTLGANLEIQYKLINTYNFLQEREITPKSLREFKEAVKNFDEDVKCVYKKKKYYLSSNVLGLLDQIMKFNHLLEFCIIKEDFFDFSFEQLFSDIFLYRPWEFACKHKLLVGGILLLAGGMVAATYGYPVYVAHKLANQNPNYQCHQLHGFSQPAGSGDCGYYATVHTLLMMNAGPQADAATMQQNFNDISSINSVIDRLKTIYRGADWLDGDQVRNILNPGIIRQFAADFQNIGVALEDFDFNDIHMIENVQLLAQGQGIEPELINAINRFRRLNRPQGIVLFLGANRANQGGHWISLRLQRNAQGIIEPILADSLWLNNVTNNNLVNQIIRLFENQPIQSQYGLANITPSLDNATNIIGGAGNFAQEIDRYQAVANHFARALRNIDAAGDGQRAQELAFYRNDITNFFTQLRNTALQLGIHQLALDQAPHFLDLDQVQNLDQCIVTILGHQIA